MPAIKYFTVAQTREVKVRVVPEAGQSYEEAALHGANQAFENSDGVKITSVVITLIKLQG